jgi:hypothetical protein
MEMKREKRIRLPVILDTWEAEIRKTKIQGQPREIVHPTPSPK